MTKNLSRYKKKQNEIYASAISEIKKGKKETNWIEYFFPLIHGLDIIEDEGYEINNVIEAREFLNDKTLINNLITISNMILKSKVSLIELLGEKDSEKLKSSVTLFNYITNTNFKNLLLFRGYEEKLVKKVFLENEEFKIFKEILNKLFNAEQDNKTILLIESELLEYSLKSNTLKNIDKKELPQAEDILIKYSKFSPLVISSVDRSKVLKSSREFFKNLSNEEYEIFSKFNIDKCILKYASKTRHEIKNKLMISVIPTISLIGLIILTMLKTPTVAYTNTEIDAILPMKACMPAVSEIETIEEVAKTKEEIIEEPIIAPQEEVYIEELPEPTYYEPQYTYVEPTGVGNVDVVNIALSQVGNVGGYPYWSWYGFQSRVDWCSIFVSWVANQAGIPENVIPKFARASVGAEWFIDNNLFRGRDYSPREGDLIFFDWDYNGISDHAGYVRYAENGMVYTVEGNTQYDDCSTHSYPMNSNYILGYGTPNY